MICFDSGTVVFPETVEMFANPTSGRRAPRHLSMRMIANTLLSVGTSRASFEQGRQGGTGSSEESHQCPGHDKPRLRAGKILRRLLPRLEAV